MWCRQTSWNCYFYWKRGKQSLCLALCPCAQFPSRACPSRGHTVDVMIPVDQLQRKHGTLLLCKELHQFKLPPLTTYNTSYFHFSPKNLFVLENLGTFVSATSRFFKWKDTRSKPGYPDLSALTLPKEPFYN